jgi:hypothetical protein
MPNETSSNFRTTPRALSRLARKPTSGYKGKHQVIGKYFILQLPRRRRANAFREMSEIRVFGEGRAALMKKAAIGVRARLPNKVPLMRRRLSGDLLGLGYLIHNRQVLN